MQVSYYRLAIQIKKQAQFDPKELHRMQRLLQVLQVANPNEVPSSCRPSVFL